MTGNDGDVFGFTAFEQVVAIDDAVFAFDVFLVTTVTAQALVGQQGQDLQREFTLGGLHRIDFSRIHFSRCVRVIRFVGPCGTGERGQCDATQ